jgi:Gram-negative bacterial TonB protein C-terminal
MLFSGASLAGMRRFLWILLGLLAALPAWAKGDKQAKDTVAKDPRAMLAAAAPFYDYTSPDLKPWHLKATYQLYDEQGKPTEQGTYEFWWASPTAYRSTWTRKSASESDWTTDKGAYFLFEAADSPGFYERTLKKELLSPLPDAAQLDAANSEFRATGMQRGGSEMECVMVIPRRLGTSSIAAIQMGLFPTYCFDTRLSALLADYSLGGITAQFPQVVQTQGHYLAKQIVLSERGNTVLSATVDTVEGIVATDAAFTPAPGAILAIHHVAQATHKKEPKAKPGESEAVGPAVVPLKDQVAQGMLLYRVNPSYPQAALTIRAQGTVVLNALIGKDGRVHDLRVISAPSALLIEPSIAAVMQWRYRPYLLGNKPVEVETTINVVYALGR